LIRFAALAAALLVAACSEDDRPDADDGSCYGGLECRVVEVPEVHAAPDAGPKLGVKVIIGHAPGGAGHAPVIYLEGGPGGTVEGVAQSGFVQHAANALGRDFVLLEQRGNTLSRPALDCGITDETDPDPPTLQRCTAKYTQLGYRIEAFNTIENAHDIDDVRRALGVPKVILWGGSYGGELAQTAARLHPDTIAGELLESAAMTGRPYRPFEQMRAQPTKLAAFFAWLTDACKASQRCSILMPGLDAASELTQFQARVATQPFTLTPQLTLDSADAARLLVLITMYSIPNAVLVIRMMYAANHDQVGAFDQIRIGSESARDYIARIIAFASVNRTSNLIYDCYDTVLNWNDAGLAAALDGVYTAAERPAIDEQIAATRAACQALPAASIPQTELAVATVTSVPTIFFHGGLDWPTPIENVESDLAHFSRSQLVRVPCAGHGIQSAIPECFAKIASTFFSQADDGSFNGTIDASCTADFCRPGLDQPIFVEQ
jgi:pimeloyl-ACP methyl ester carboxylesterase